MSWNRPPSGGPNWQRRQGRAGRWWRAGAVLVAVAVLGIGAYQFFLVPHAYSGTVERPEDYEAGCYGAGGRKHFPGSDAYVTTNGSHPIAIFLAGEASEHKYAMDGVASGSDQDDWDGSRSKGPQHVQLIACLSAPAGGEPIGTCEFNASSLALHRGLYEFTLYEAKTGAKVTTGKISGSGKKSCPMLTLTREGADKIHTRPDLAEYHRVLGRYVRP